MKPKIFELNSPFEAVSALVDGEVAGDARRRLIERCARQAGWSAQWSAYVLAGDALRSPEVAARHSPGFALRLRERLAAEPVHRLPAAGLASRAAWAPQALAAAVTALAFVLVPLAQTLDPQPGAARSVTAAAPRALAQAPVLNPDDPEPLLVAGWEEG